MVTIKQWLMASVIGVLLLAGTYSAGYRSGWYAHSDKVNLDYANRKQQAENKQAKSTAQAQQVKVVTETKFKTIYRDTVKYVQNPDRTVSNFDDDYIRLRQSAIDADSAITRTSVGGVRITESGTEKHR